MSQTTIKPAAIKKTVTVRATPEKAFETFTAGFERATDVTGPWSTIATITAPEEGLIEFQDTNAPANRAFYRVVLPLVP